MCGPQKGHGRSPYSLATDWMAPECHNFSSQVMMSFVEFCWLLVDFLSQ